MHFQSTMSCKFGSIKLTALILACAKFLLVASENQSKRKPTAAMSVLFLAIPVMIGLTAVTVLTRKLYFACAKKFEPEEDIAIRGMAEEFSTSLDTTDSFDQVKLKCNEEHVIVPWNPFQKKYTNVETKNDIDPLEEMEASFVERKMIKIIPMVTAPSTPSTPSAELLWSPKPVHDFSRLDQGTYARSPPLIRSNLGVSIRV